MAGGDANIVVVAMMIGDPVLLSLSVSSGRVALSLNTLYRMWASVDCFVKYGDSAVVAVTTSHPMTAKVEYIFKTDSVYLAGIVSTGTGTLFVSELRVGKSVF